MAPLGALTQAWVSAEASLPLGWQIRGLWRFDDLWVALSEGPTFDDYLSGSGHYADQALRAGRRPPRLAKGIISNLGRSRNAWHNLCNWWPAHTT